MMEKMFANVIPLLLMKAAQIPEAEKRAFALFIGELCSAYVENDHLRFRQLMNKTSFAPEVKSGIYQALWGYENQSK